MTCQLSTTLYYCVMSEEMARTWLQMSETNDWLDTLPSNWRKSNTIQSDNDYLKACLSRIKSRVDMDINFKDSWYQELIHCSAIKITLVKTLILLSWSGNFVCFFLFRFLCSLILLPLFSSYLSSVSSFILIYLSLVNFVRAWLTPLIDWLTNLPIC